MSPPIAIVAGAGGELGRVSLVVVPLDDRAMQLISQL